MCAGIQGIRSAGRVFPGIKTEGCNEGKKPRDGFFVRSGISPEDGANLYKVILRLSIQLKTGMDFFLHLSIFDLKNIIEEVVALGKQQRVQIGNKDRR